MTQSLRPSRHIRLQSFRLPKSVRGYDDHTQALWFERLNIGQLCLVKGQVEAISGFVSVHVHGSDR
jgi:hypothetical protein